VRVDLLYRFINKIIIIFEERQDVFNSTLHVVEVMRTGYPTRCLLKLDIEPVRLGRRRQLRRQQHALAVATSIRDGVLGTTDVRDGQTPPGVLFSEFDAAR